MKKPQRLSAYPCHQERIQRNPGMLRVTIMLSLEFIMKTRSQVEFWNVLKTKTKINILKGQKTLSPKPVKKSFKSNKRKVESLHFRKILKIFLSSGIETARSSENLSSAKTRKRRTPARLRLRMRQ